MTGTCDIFIFSVPKLRKYDVLGALKPNKYENAVPLDEVEEKEEQEVENNGQI